MRKGEEVLALGDSQLECLRKSSHCLGRELHILALLEPCVPAHADPSQLRQLLTPQSKGSAAVDALGESDVLGPQRRTSGTKERPQLLALLLGWHGILLDRGRKLSLTVFVLGERGSRTQHCRALASRLAWGGSRGGCCTRSSKRRRLQPEPSPLRNCATAMRVADRVASVGLAGMTPNSASQSRTDARSIRWGELLQFVRPGCARCWTACSPSPSCSSIGSTDANGRRRCGFGRSSPAAGQGGWAVLCRRGQRSRCR